MKQWRAADKLYLAQLKVINLTFLAAVATAKMNLSTSLAQRHQLHRTNQCASDLPLRHHRGHHRSIERPDDPGQAAGQAGQEARGHHDEAVGRSTSAPDCFAISTASS